MIATKPQLYDWVTAPKRMDSRTAGLSDFRTGQVVNYGSSGNPIVRFSLIRDEEVDVDSLRSADTYRETFESGPYETNPEERLRNGLMKSLRLHIHDIDDTRATFKSHKHAVPEGISSQLGPETTRMTIIYRVFPQDRMRSA